MIVPAFFYLEVESKALKEHHARIYKMVEDEYRAFENSGDILKLNKEVQVFDIIWPETSKSKQVL